MNVAELAGIVERGVDCPDLPNGTRKRPFCCQRDARARRDRLEIGQVLPMPERKLVVRPAFTGAGGPTFKPARHGKRAPGK